MSSKNVATGSKKNVAAHKAEEHKTDEHKEESVSFKQLPWASPELCKRVTELVNREVPVGSGKGILPLTLLTDETVGKHFGFEQPEERTKKNADNEEETYTFYTPAAREALNMLGFTLRNGLVDGLVQRMMPFGGYGRSVDEALWKNHPINERQYGARKKAYMNLPKAYLRAAFDALCSLIPKPADFVKGKGSDLIPVDVAGNKLNRSTKVRDIAKAMYEATKNIDFMGSENENLIKQALIGGLLGQTAQTREGVCWLTDAEAVAIAADRRDSNEYDKVENPTGNKKAGNDPTFAFSEPPTFEELDRLLNGKTAVKTVEVSSNESDEANDVANDGASDDSQEPVVATRNIPMPTVRRRGAKAA